MPKVMVIEDDESMLSLLLTLLEMEGFDACAFDKAQGLEDAWQMVKLERPDLILLDIHVGKWNGFELLQRIKSDASLEDLRILMSSGMELSMKSRVEGADGFILKPYMPDDLVGQIRDILRM